MNYQEFISIIKELVSSHLTEDIHATLHTTLKNNGKERVGITFVNNRFRIHPTLYLEEFYTSYQKGASIDELAEHILSIYNDLQFDGDFNANFIFDFEEAKSQIAYKLINTQKNYLLLQTMPHIPFHDLSIVFFLNYEEDFPGSATIPITNEMIRLWNTSPSALYALAQANTSTLFPATFKPIQMVINELLGSVPDDNGSSVGNMYVLSNQKRSFGAATILYDDILSQIATRIKENYYILPSSIHEVIILPESESPPKEYLEEMVHTLNETDTPTEEVLTDHVYYYHIQTQELS